MTYVFTRGLAAALIALLASSVPAIAQDLNWDSDPVPTCAEFESAGMTWDRGSNPDGNPLVFDCRDNPTEWGEDPNQPTGPYRNFRFGPRQSDVYADTTGFVTFPQTRADGQYVVSLTTSYSYWRGDPDGGHTNVITQEVIEMDIVYAVQYLSSGTVADGSWTDWAIVRTLGDYPETHDGLHSFTDTLSVVPGSYFRIRGSVVDPGPIKDRLVQDFGIGFIWQQRVKEDSPPPVYVNAAGNPVGVEATPAALQVSVHPNPSSDWVKVDMRGGTVGTVHVFDVLGRRVRTVQGPEIPVRDLPSGQYALLVGTGPLQPQVVSVVRITVVH